MPPKPVGQKIVNRFANTFTSQVARRSLRALGTPTTLIPFAIGLVREVNRQIQWGNKTVWNRRIEMAKQLYDEFKEKQNELSPVYRYRGGSKTVRPHLSNETIRDKIRDPNAYVDKAPRKTYNRFDPGTVMLGGLGFVIVASIAGPSLAKKVNYVDPLDTLEANIGSNSTEDLKGIQLRH